MKVLQRRESNKECPAPGLFPSEIAEPGKPEIADAVWSITPQRGKERSSKKQLADALKRIPKAQMPSLNQLCEAIEAWKKSEGWTKDGGLYVPGIHRWVNDRKWENLPTEEHPAAHNGKQPLSQEEAMRLLGGRAASALSPLPWE